METLSGDGVQIERLRNLIHEVCDGTTESIEAIPKAKEKLAHDLDFDNILLHARDREELTFRGFSLGSVVLCLPTTCSHAWGVFNVGCPHFYCHVPEEVSDREWVIGRIKTIEEFGHADLDASRYYGMGGGHPYTIVSLEILYTSHR